MRRHALGVISILFVAVGVRLLMFGADTGNDQVLAAPAMRIGLLLGAVWLALPQLAEMGSRVPPWLIACVAISGLIIAVRPRLAIYLIPVAVALAVVQFIGWLFKPPPP